jgi:hypothetical protein
MRELVISISNRVYYMIPECGITRLCDILMFAHEESLTADETLIMAGVFCIPEMTSERSFHVSSLGEVVFMRTDLFSELRFPLFEIHHYPIFMSFY